MSVDRSWMYNRTVGGVLRDDFQKGVEEFLLFAFDRTNYVSRDTIRCPCTICLNSKWKDRGDVKYDLFQYGFKPNYTWWSNHGETLLENQKTREVDRDSIRQTYECRNMVRDAAGPDFYWDIDGDHFIDEDPNEEASGFFNLLKESEVPLYDGHEKYNVLSAVTKILHYKTEHDCSERAMEDLLTLVKDFLPVDNKLPTSYYQVKKLVKKLNLGYHKIDACEKDCMLYYGETKDKKVCDVCNTPRYKEKRRKGGKDVSRKVLRYFPIAPRLQRLFMSPHSAKHMRWHIMRDTAAGELRHPADGDEWKMFDHNFPSFSQEVRNVRLGLATDGFNPFGPASKPYSTWPVIVVVYNLPPWMSMKEPYMFTTLLIPGEKSPAKDLNVYLRPLVDELKMLWDKGVQTYDASLKQNFIMNAALLWTINDFPALGMISGWSTHGSLSCPVCMTASTGIKLRYGGKASYFGCHRQFLPIAHRFRSLTKEFNKNTEHRQVRGRLSGVQVLSWINSIQFPLPGKNYTKERAEHYGDLHNWTHKCMFFELPYWTTLKVRHNLDVMHIEKNIFDNVFNTVLNVKGKTKDNAKSRKDLKEMGIRPNLHLVESRTKTAMPKASFVITKEHLKLLCAWVKELKLPDGYVSNISRCCNVEDCKFLGLKSHDCHVFMQRLIPVAFRDLLPKPIVDALIELSHFFRDLCSTVLKHNDLENMEKNIVEILCKLEMIFPPSFFDSMEHLAVHLASEAKLGGPVQYRWMYPFERYMRKMKQKVHNRARVEGSIAELYVIEELVNFCSLYFESTIQTRHNRLGRNEVDSVEDNRRLSVFTHPGEPIGATSSVRVLTEKEYNATTLYTLLNTPEVNPYIEKYENEVIATNPNISLDEMEDFRTKNFTSWFKRTVNEDNAIDARLKILADGPERFVNTYIGYKVNGYRFHTVEMDGLTTSNSGVIVKGSYYNDAQRDWYGQLIEVVRLRYWGCNYVTLFKCEWFDILHGVKVDERGIVRVNVKSRLNSNDPFVLASQVAQVYYARGVLPRKEPDWCTVIVTKARSFTADIICAEDEPLQENDIPVTVVNTTPGDIIQITNLYVDLVGSFGEEVNGDDDDVEEVDGGDLEDYDYESSEDYDTDGFEDVE